MVRPEARLLRGFAVGAAVALTLAACGGGTTSSGSPGAGGSTAPTARGTIDILTQAEQWGQGDPQRLYTGEDLAFFGAARQPAPSAVKISAAPKEGTSRVPHPSAA